MAKIQLKCGHTKRFVMVSVLADVLKHNLSNNRVKLGFFCHKCGTFVVPQ